jgi:hypothetical protein
MRAARGVQKCSEAGADGNVRAVASSSSCYQSSHSINAIDPAPHWSGRKAVACTMACVISKLRHERLLLNVKLSG